ncbi:MAG: FAD-binding oxidoreductase [Gammaproteobacteria bacterium]|nr:FAD-binding oxidoreductase [Gammaproteobacteria bacterium]MDD9894631.1 FAD-binding oxidoreductase [Gammaproteobacteria bacterium]
MQLHGWGRYPRIDSEQLEPASIEFVQAIINDKGFRDSVIPRGGGRSYGDSALARNVISTRFLDSFLQFNEEHGTIRCGAGVTIEHLLRVAIPKGYFAPVLPGTRFVTIGGAIAADIHGKNHQRDGSFCDHIERFSLLLASGEVLECSREENVEAFVATCGGMGLTGIVLEASLKLEKVPSITIRRESLVAANLGECIELIEKHQASKYSVAWLDCQAKGEMLGRSVLHLAEHEECGSQEFRKRWGPTVPFSTPAFLLNKYSTKLFNNALYSLRKKTAGVKIVNYDSYFFPLDNIKHWNRVFGRKGFMQYQLVVPTDSAKVALTEILKLVADSGKGLVVSVLKKFGESNENLLSFPSAGYTLTLDFKNEPTVFALLDRLDQIVLAHGGKLYLAKDARMSENVFKNSYNNWEKFVEIKNALDPDCKFASLQSKRIGLTSQV